MRLYLIRHGQSTNNALHDQTLRSYDPELTTLGEKQAERLATYIGGTEDYPDSEKGYSVTHIYCSAMIRAMQTAQPLAKCLGITPEIWLDIHEIGGIFLAYADGTEQAFGGVTRSQIAKRFEGYIIPDTITENGWYDTEHGHETAPQFLSRAIRVGHALRQRAESDERLVLVSHAAFLDALIKVLLYQAPRHPREFFYMHHNTGITRFDFNEGTDREQLHYLNRTAHLTPDLRSW